MKKLAITGAAVALAAMPALGAFADVTDTVTITINSSCTAGSTSSSAGTGSSFTDTMTNGSLKSWDATSSTGGKIVISCNDASGWNVKAVGASTGSDNTVMVPTNTGAANAIATGTATQGATSNWAFKVAGTGVVTTYASYAPVPATATKVAANSDAASELTLYTGYQVWVSATQAADTYTGKVTYTVAQGAN